MRNIYTRILGEEFMNSPVEGTIGESKFIEKRIKEFKERNKINNN